MIDCAAILSRPALAGLRLGNRLGVQSLLGGLMPFIRKLTIPRSLLRLGNLLKLLKGVQFGKVGAGVYKPQKIPYHL